MLAVLLREESGMIKTEVMPFLSEDSHDIRACMRVLLSFKPIHVGFPKVSNVMNKECHPESWISWEAIELPPRSRNEPWVNGELMRPE